MNSITNDSRIRAMMRPPETVMRLERMGSFHQSRLSFMRSLLRMMKREQWTFSRPVWRIDADGVGVAVYQAKGPRRTYSLIAFAHDLDPAKRTDRSIATAWDATFTLYDGVPDEADLARLSQNVPKQEAGRVTQTELSLSRANKSVRLFNHVVDRLAAGQQPDPDQIEAVGYLMRTTAVYGSAKFGAASRDMTKDRPEISRPFHIEMLSVYLTRSFTVDLAEHLARTKAPDTAVTINPALRRRLGVGNSTGLGLAPYLINHPVLVHNWINARECALARVRLLASATPDQAANFHRALARATASIGDWKTMDQRQAERINQLCTDLARLNSHIDNQGLVGSQPWNALYQWGADNLHPEAQELLVSLLIEPFGELVDDLLDSMSADEQAEFRIDGLMDLAQLRDILKRRYGWVPAIDFDRQENSARFWYVSAHKAEPRLGERATEPQSETYEEPLDIARWITNMTKALASFDDKTTVAEFLLTHPQFRKLVRRIQIIDRHPYGEICDNLISQQMRPIDMLRCKLSFFGATDFDPRSDRWVRITMYKNAPYPNELANSSHDNWAYSQAGAGS